MAAERPEQADEPSETSTRALAIVDAYGRVRAVSGAFASTLRIRREDLFSRPLPTAVRPDDRPALVHAIAAVSSGEWPGCTLDVRFIQHGREERALRLVLASDAAQRVTIEASEPGEGATGTYPVQQLVEQALTGIVVVRQGRIVYANPRFLELAGMDADALAERPRALSLLDRSSIPALREVRNSMAIGSRQSTRVQVRGRHSSGRLVDVDVATRTVEFDKRPALLCTVTDVTEVRELHARMAETEKVEAVALLAGGVAHDFNNMLTGILAWVDIAADELGPESPVVQALGEIRSAAERGAELTRQLIAFGQRQLLEAEPLDLGELVMRLKWWVDRTLSPDHRLEITVPDVSWLIEGDRVQLERALTALIANAKDAMPGGGVIQLAISHEVLTTERAEALGPLGAGEHVVASVRDSGVGMDETTRRRIFEPFFTTKSGGQGTGLGLPAVLGTVLQSGGAIDVRSAPGEGAEFRCYFPRLQATRERPPGRRRTPEPTLRTARSVLVVEDDPELGKVLRKLLHARGHAVRLASSTAEAEALATTEPADVVVCDVELAGMRGSALAGDLRARGLAHGAVLISGSTIDGATLAEAGEYAVPLQKPFRPQQLLDAVDQAARRGAGGRAP